MANILVTASQCPWSRKAVSYANQLGLAAGIQMASADDVATNRWFRAAPINGSVTPTLLVREGANFRKIEGYPAVSQALYAQAGGRPMPAGQVTSTSPAQKPPSAPSYAIYVTGSCGACARALQLISSTPSLLKAIEVRNMDGSTDKSLKYRLDVHGVGASQTPVILEFRDGKVAYTYEGHAAWAKLVQIG